MRRLWIVLVVLVWIIVRVAAAQTPELRDASPELWGVQYLLAAHASVTPHLALERHAPFAVVDPEECFACHDDETLTMEKGGREISLYVDPAAYDASPHGQQECLDCHVGFDPDEEPHKDPITPVDCASCHASPTRLFRQSKHAAGATCASCHGNAHVPPPRLAQEQTCGRCHDEAVADVRLSAHAASEAGPRCLDCHTPHAVELADSDKCLSCHGEKTFVHQYIAHEDLEAVLSYAESIHGGLIECSDCHTGHRVLAASDTASTVARLNIAPTCAHCHDDVAEVFLASEHGKAVQEGVASAPTCTDCHGEHDVHQIADGQSLVSREHEVEVCLNCHLDAPEVRQRMTRSSAFISSYAESIHGRAVAAGNLEAAVCSDCHGAHGAMKASNPGSAVHKFNMAATCGHCHEEIEATFTESTHGDALAQGVADAPTCTDCHGEHAILEPGRAESPVAALNVSQQVCSPCHNSVKLSEKYGFPSDRLATFGDSYHGLAGRFGSKEVANCASCHGVHDIWPSSDPRSKVHKDNLQETCGQCHPGATARFAEGNVHVIRTLEGDRLLYWISSIYIFLIIAVVGAMAVHNGLDWGRKLVDRYRERLAPPPAPAVQKTGLYVRMMRGERVQHALLALSFILLVATGFMLKYPEAWWVLLLRKIVGESLFDLRGLVHRIAAVVMISVSCYHLYYLLFTVRGRQFVRDIFLRGRDAKEMLHALKYNLGMAASKPRFARFNYVEKIEYWALVWGTVIMTVTGLVLWFENQFMGRFSKLFVDVGETIHYYEAWLAFLAIIVWHFYYVIFNPDVYPMNFTWLTGKLTEEEMEREHPRELEKLREAQQEDQALPGE